MRSLPVAITGLTAILLQVTALRRLLAVFSGNELVIGSTLAIWLLFVGVGSFLGARVRTRRAFGSSFFAVSLLVQATVFFIGLIRPVFGLLPGETVSLTTTLISTILALLPLCLALGAQFPLAVAYLKGDSSRAYGLEAAGAFAGGALFTFVLAGRMDAPLLAAVVSALNALVAVLLFRKKRLAWLLVVPALLFFGFNRLSELASDQDQDLVQKVESRYGELAVFEAQDQFTVFASGALAFSYPDSQTEEWKAHLPMSLHAAPARVLLIDGSPAVAREFLKYPGTTVDFVELDPMLLDVSFGILSRKDRGLLTGNRFRAVAADARKFIKATAAKYDLVVLDLPEPSTANLNRFYTVEFFREVRAALDGPGILALTLPASHGYIGRHLQAANGAVYRSLKAVFRAVVVSSEEYGGMYASDAPIDVTPNTLAGRFNGRRVATEYFHPLLFNDIFDPLKTNMVASRLGNTDVVNTDQRPIAYLYNLMLWSDMEGGSVLNRLLDATGREVFIALGATVLCAALLFWKRRRTVFYTLFTTGYATMAFTVIVLLSYQASYGYLYERIGLLTALFMAGSSSAAYLARRLEDPLRWLRIVELSGVLLFLLAPVFFFHEVLYYALVLLCGVMGGAGFVLVTRYAEGPRTGGLAGSLYALDLAGSVLGALLISILLVPLLGVGNALLTLVLIKGSSLVLLFSLGNAGRDG